MPVYLTNTHCSGVGTEVSHAIVSIDRETAKHIIARNEALLSLRKTEGFENLHTLAFWNNLPDFLPYNEQMYDRAKDEDFVRISPGSSAPEAVRTECGQMIVEADGVYWDACVKHTSSVVETAKIPMEEIRRIAGKPSGGKKKAASTTPG